MNQDLRKKIVQMVYKAKDGHIPSAFSIVDILDILYGKILKTNPQSVKSPDRDYFILSKGHGCVALYTVLEKYGFIGDEFINSFCQKGGLLGEHPDCTKIPGVEASTGSLGHGLPFAVGIALGLKIEKKPNRIFVLVGDGECHEGTIWEAANVAHNLKLSNLCVVVDWNGSAAQLMPLDDLPAKWKAFGWNTQVIDGHDAMQIENAFKQVLSSEAQAPSVIVAKTIKGKGVPMIEGHGIWHHKIPNAQELEQILASLMP